MTSSFTRLCLLAALLSGLNLSLAADKPAAEPVVKKSDSGICHDKTSPSFANTK